MLPLDKGDRSLSLTSKLSLVYIVVFIGVIIFADPSWMRQQIRDEVASFQQWTGPEAGQQVTQKAQDWYYFLFKNSGIEALVNDFFAPDLSLIESNTGLVNAGNPIFSKLTTGVENFWLLMYQSVFRMAVLQYWMIFAVGLSLAAFCDGLVKRKIKQYTFGWSSVNVFRLSVKALVTAPFLIITYLSIPVVPSYAHFMPLIIFIGLGIAMHYMASNMQRVF